MASSNFSNCYVNISMPWWFSRALIPSLVVYSVIHGRIFGSLPNIEPALKFSLRFIRVSKIRFKDVPS